jgi:hypothetical protein
LAFFNKAAAQNFFLHDNQTLAASRIDKSVSRKITIAPVAAWHVYCSKYPENLGGNFSNG